MRDMTLGDRIEIKLYAYADGSGNGEPRSMTLGEARSFIREGSDTDLVDALVRLASSGFVSLDKWVPNENRFVSFGEFPNVRSFFYGPPFGAFRAAVTASGRHDFEHRTPPERRPSSQKADPSPPIKENERWKIIRTLTEGGQGQLFLVSDTTNRIQSTCVLKRLKNITSEERRSRFTREVEATQRIRHPNVLRVHDDGCSGAHHRRDSRCPCRWRHSPRPETCEHIVPGRRNSCRCRFWNLPYRGRAACNRLRRRGRLAKLHRSGNGIRAAQSRRRFRSDRCLQPWQSHLLDAVGR
jgi:hypothetical protein